MYIDCIMKDEGYQQEPNFKIMYIDGIMKDNPPIKERKKIMHLQKIIKTSMHILKISVTHFI